MEQTVYVVEVYDQYHDVVSTMVVSELVDPRHYGAPDWWFDWRYASSVYAIEHTVDSYRPVQDVGFNPKWTWDTKHNQWTRC